MPKKASARRQRATDATATLSRQRRVIAGLVLAIIALFAALQVVSGLWVILPTLGLMLLLVLLVRESVGFLGDMRGHDVPVSDVPQRRGEHGSRPSRRTTKLARR